MTIRGNLYLLPHPPKTDDQQWNEWYKYWNTYELSRARLLEKSIPAGALSGNLTGPITSVGLATSVASQTGTGTTFAMQTAPTLLGSGSATAAVTLQNGQLLFNNTTTYGGIYNTTGDVALQINGGTTASVGGLLNLYGRIHATNPGWATLTGTNGTGSLSLTLNPTTGIASFNSPVSLSGQLASTLATGTAPLSIASTTLVPNLYVARAALADTVTTNANLTGVVTSVGNATSLGSFTSANLSAALTDETGTGAAVFANSPVFTTPNIGSATGSISGNAATVTTNANLTGPITSVGNATSVASQTGTGTTFAMSASPTFTGTVTTGHQVLSAAFLFQQFRDTNTTVTNGGLTRFAGNGSGTWQYQINTAAGGDFSTAITAYQIAATGNITLGAGEIGKGGALGHHVDAYGALANGTNDDSVQIQLAMNAAAAGTNGSNTVVVGAKTYTCKTALTLPLSATTIKMIGEGCHGATASVLNFSVGVMGVSLTSASALNTANSLDHIQLRNVQITSAGAGAGTPPIGLQIGTSGAFEIDSYAKHVVEDVLVLGWAVGIKQINARQVNYANVVSRCEAGSNATALYMTCDNTLSFMGDADFTNCDFSVSSVAANSTTNSCVRIENTVAGVKAAGIKFTGCDFYYGGVAGVYVINTNATGTIGDVFFDECQWDGNATNNGVALLLENSAAGTIRNVRVGKSFMNGFNKAFSCTNATGVIDNVSIDDNFLSQCTQNAIIVDGAGTASVTITGNTIYNCGDNTVNAYGILLNNGRNIVVNGNTHRGTAGAASNMQYMVGINAGVTDYVVMGNVGQVRATGAAVNDLGGAVNKYVAGNISY